MWFALDDESIVWAETDVVQAVVRQLHLDDSSQCVQ